MRCSLVFIAIAGLTALPSVIADGGFVGSCQDIYAWISGDDRGIGANCKQANGQLHTTKLSMAGCFGNNNGNFQCQPGLVLFAEFTIK